MSTTGQTSDPQNTADWERRLVKPEGCTCTIDLVNPGRSRAFRWVYDKNCPVLPEQHVAQHEVVGFVFKTEAKSGGITGSGYLVKP